MEKTNPFKLPSGFGGPAPNARSPVVLEPKDWKKTSKSFVTEEASVDSFIGNFAGGSMSIVMGPRNAGKSTLASMLAFNGLKQGYKVAYVDIENKLNINRLLQMHAAWGKPFPASKLSQFRYALDREWSFGELFSWVVDALPLVPPDLLIFDALSSLVNDSILTANKKAGENYEIFSERYVLATRCRKLAVEKDVAVIIIAHEHPRVTINEDKSGLLIQSMDEYAAIGYQFGYQADTIVHLGYLKDGNRGMALLKHPFKDTKPVTELLKLEDFMKYRINDRGLVGIGK